DAVVPTGLDDSEVLPEEGCRAHCWAELGRQSVKLGRVAMTRKKN